MKAWGIAYIQTSKRAIGGVLIQEHENGEKLLVSTASRVIKEVQQRYSVAEQELLAIIYALTKFRLYIYGSEVTLYTDNRALSFLDRCTLTSSRITRWVMELQEYNLNIKHISGSQNYLADALSRNPSNLSESEIKELSKPRSILVAKIELELDTSIGEKLKNIGELQKREEGLKAIINHTRQLEGQTDGRFLVREGVLLRKDSTAYPFWRPVIPAALEVDVIKYVHSYIGHLGTEKCMNHISHSMYIKGLGRKVRKVIATCEKCQKAKHPHIKYMTETRSHLPTAPGELCAVDLYGKLPTGRGGVKYIFVVVDVFSKYVALYALKSATTKSCLNKITEHYITRVTKPAKILSDNGTQFSSPAWKRGLSAHGIEPLYVPVRRPESNPAERYMVLLNAFFRIYCNINHRKWPELLPYIEQWINQSVSQSTGYTPIELMEGKPKPDIFEDLLTKEMEQFPEEETGHQKALKAFIKMKQKAEKRNSKRKLGKHVWEPQIDDLVLVKQQATSDAAISKSSKFVLPYLGPFKITKITPPATFELRDMNNKLRGVYCSRPRFGFES
jgi:transposase InsO family protein